MKDNFKEIRGQIKEMTKDYEELSDGLNQLNKAITPLVPFLEKHGITIVLNKEEDAVLKVDNFCAASLDPETHDKWEDVKEQLIINRNLKITT